MSCLSKGLAAPVGSLLAGPAEVISVARGYRKRLGGAMRQAGVIAAAGLVALRQGIDRLAEDHARAQRLAEAVAERWPDGGFDPTAVQTNIVVFAPPDADGLIDHLAGAGVLAGTVAPGVVRLVTHLDVDDAGVDLARKAISTAPGP
jgi:threonine aldolase